MIDLNNLLITEITDQDNLLKWLTKWLAEWWIAD